MWKSHASTFALDSLDRLILLGVASALVNVADAEAAWTAGRIRELRMALRLTQMEFAVAVGVTYSTINRWENAHSRPTALAVRRLEEMAAASTSLPHQKEIV